MEKDLTKRFTLLPSVQDVLAELSDTPVRHHILVSLIRQVLDTARSDIQKKNLNFKNKTAALKYVITRVETELERLTQSPLRRVINGTGIVLHTGLGRAPLGKELLDFLATLLPAYVNLEFELASGKRGERLHLTETLLSLLTGAEATALVNNNAAAVLLALNTVAQGREVVVSRGQLIEIGGSFRLPDVVLKSGAQLKEVGTTNRTHLQDYREAINENTAAILVAHPSNYRIEGFVTMPELTEVIALAHEIDIPVIMDLGSGALFPPQSVGLPSEYEVSEIVGKGVDLVTFSGDKLLGGAQGGIIIGKKQWIEQVRRNPLMRALRCDKLTYAVFTWVLRRYIDRADPPGLAAYELLTTSEKVLKERAAEIIAQISKSVCAFFQLKSIRSSTEAGSGSMPTETIPSAALEFDCKHVSEAEIASAFRRHDPPIIGYLRKGKFYIDLKALFPEELPVIAAAIEHTGQQMR